jgi:hypothetical protein
MLQRFTRLAVHVPIPDAASDVGPDIISANAVQEMLRIFRKYTFTGKVGTYNAVTEISRSEEVFTPTQESTPTEGRANVPSNVASARLVTYLPITTPSEELDTLICEIVSAHSWEHPVLEVDEVSLWMPS